jgi:chromosome partitioning protein
MGQILTVATSKGGGGKTTLAACLAANLAAQGYRVAVVDADPNATFSDWHSVYEGPPFVCVVEARHIEVVDVAQAQADAHDVVLVDTAGFGNLTAASAMGAADFVLIPCMPDRGSIREALRTAQQTDSLARAARRAISYRIVLTQWREGGLVERATLDELAELPLLAHRLPFLSGFRKATFDGKVPVTGRIGHEADKLIAELARLGALPALAEGVA